MACRQAGFHGAMGYTIHSQKSKMDYDFVMSYVDCKEFNEFMDDYYFYGDLLDNDIQLCSYHALNVTCSENIAGAVCVSK